MKAAITTTPTDIATVSTRGGTYKVQNDGTEDVYLARSLDDANADDYDNVLAAGFETDIYLAGDGYADDRLYAFTATGTSTLRFLYQR